MQSPPTLVFLHYLGGSARTWSPLQAELGLPFLSIDLPGFGDAHDVQGDTVTAMADHVAAAIRAASPPSWALIGHSMGAKIAAVLARRAEDGEPGLAGLSHLALLAGSPPAPEPMDDAKRAEMLAWFAADPATHRQQADQFVSDNVAAPLAPDQHAATVDDVLRADPARWRAWLQSGSREDWSGRIGRLHTPTLIVTGADDPFLGAAGQSRLTAPHFEHLRQVDLPGAKHLLPLERTTAVATLIQAHLR